MIRIYLLVSAAVVAVVFALLCWLLWAIVCDPSLWR